MILFWFWFQFLKSFLMISCCNRSFLFFFFFFRQVILALIERFLFSLSLSVFIDTHKFVCMWLWIFYCISKILLLKRINFLLLLISNINYMTGIFFSFCFLVKHRRFRFLLFHQYGRFYIQKKLHFHAMSLMDVGNHESPQITFHYL